ncbi:MAG: hypothetical protein QNJ90_09485 [Planctomycetota bacterium]|nr:hypothetical protein [Planctomycetota bacterium]
MEGVRKLQWVGIVLVAASAFWPTLDVRAYPGHPPPPSGRTGAILGGAREVPAHEIGTAVVEAVRGPERIQPLWESRRWYPWYLAPIWGLALLLAAGRIRRRIVGGLVLLLTVGLIAFEAAYLRAEYLAFLPGWLGRLELGGAWLFIVAVLLYRRRGDRRIGAVEATCAAQALLGFVHGLTLPATMFRQWLPGNEAQEVLGAVLHNFPAPFWIGMGGLLIMSLPVYLRRRSHGSGSREEGR